MRTPFFNLRTRPGFLSTTLLLTREGNSNDTETTDCEEEGGALCREVSSAIAAGLRWRVSVGGLTHYTHLALQSQFPARD